MSSKLISSFRKLKVGNLILRNTRKYTHRSLTTLMTNRYPFTKLKHSLVNGSVSVTRLATFKYYKKIVTYVPIKGIPQILKCPRHVYPDRLLNKGCNGAIFSVKNFAYEPKIILKQPYKFTPTYIDQNESSILANLSYHPNVIIFLGESSTQVGQDPRFVSECPDVEHYGLIKSMILESFGEIFLDVHKPQDVLRNVLIMEMNLDELLKKKKLNLIDRIDILTQILEGQIFLKSNSICHRDLKTSNILVKYAPDHSLLKFPIKFIAKIADFDCAVNLENVSNKEFNHQGSPVCTPPEVLNYSQENSIDLQKLYAKSDIWAIGVMAYEIFDCKYPFLNIEAKNYSLEDLPPIMTAPNIIQKLVKCLLNPEPKLRYQSCIASDILQLFRFRTTVTDEIFSLFKNMPREMFIGCCFLFEMYFSAQRFIFNPERAEFAFNFILDE